jgi:hypothetical protein
VPFPIGNYGDQASKFRVIELTGTKFTSTLKAELFMVPVVFVMSLLYWSYLWKLAPIPSEAYPYAQRMWPLQALNQSVWLTSTIRSEMKETEDKIEWKPSNLTDGAWWYWRARATDDLNVKDRKKRAYGPWSKAGYFYTDFGGKGPPPDRPVPLPEYKADASLTGVGGGRPPHAPVLVGPASGEPVSDPRPELRVLPARDPEGDPVSYYFEVDQVPTFDGTDLQTSDDRPILFQALKPPIIAAGFIFVLVGFTILSFFGLPILLIFGYLRSLNAIPHAMITEIIGALLARFYFWKKYGRQQWRLYAAVLAVGFAVGMALVGMASVAVAMIQKSVSVLIF